MKKRFFYFFTILVITSSLILIYYKVHNKYENISDERIELVYKGLFGAVDFEQVNDNFYVAFNNRIEVIKKGKPPYVLFKDDKMDIKNVEFCKDKLFFLSKREIMSIDINTREIKMCLNELPNYGDYKDVILKGYGDNVYIGIGAMTNSGVVGKDNQWVLDYPDGKDGVPYDIIVNYNNPGGFCSYDEINKDGEMIKRSIYGNSVLLKYDVNNGKVETYAWGIRNIEGLDIGSNGKIYAIIGGMENRGSRPVLNDSDYIYEIMKEQWYGFPDYSGGDAINSPRFKDLDGNTNNFLMKKHPDRNPPSPIYQHTAVGTLKFLMLDHNNMYFYDKNNNTILKGIIGENPKEYIKINNTIKVDSLKIIESRLVILDKEKGKIYRIKNLSEIKEQNTKSYKELYIGVLVIIITTLASLIVVSFLKIYK